MIGKSASVGVDQSLLEVGVVLGDEPQNGHEQEQQRENREEGVVGDQGGERPGSVVPELLDDAEDESRYPMTLLERVDAPHDPLGGVHSWTVCTLRHILRKP